MSPDFSELLAIAREPVTSSNVAAIAYSEALSAIVVEFNNGSVYGYLNCAKELFEQFQAANSKGIFLNRHIKPTKEYVQLA